MNFATSLEAGLTVLAVALSLDLVFGEPPNRFHPVVWMGRFASALERFAPEEGTLRQLGFGAFVAATVPLTFSLASVAVLATVGPGSIVGFAISAVLLKTTFSLRALGEAAAAVRSAVAVSDLAAARHGLRALCSRDPTHLSEAALVAATVESVAENASDSFVAPLLYYAIFGLPGAVFYRAVNTLDSIIGYHGRYEYLGKPAARLDDLLNFVPARITAALLVLAAPLVGLRGRHGLRIVLRDARRTESPNAGYPMGAMAGVLSVELEKRGHYRLGDPIEPLGAAKIDEAWGLVKVAAAIGVAVCAAIVGARHACACS